MGHDVVLGTRDPKKLDEKKNMAATLNEWLIATQGKTRVAAFKEAAAHGEILISCTHGQISVEALKLAEADKVGSKILIDTANELDASQGMPPRVLAGQDRSVSENIQKTFPNLKVVKSLNTINCKVMVNPKAVHDGDHTIFVSGNDAEAKAKVTDLLKSFGWSDVLDLGDLSSARGPEMYMALWLRLWGATKSGMINIKVQR